MPKTTTKKVTNKSSSSGRPISSRTRQAASNLLTMNNSSSTTRRSTTSATRTSSSSTTRKSTTSATRKSSSSSNTTIHFIPIKKTKKESNNNRFSRRLHYISCSSWFTVDTYLEPLHPNKTSRSPVKVGDKYCIMNPFSGFNEVHVERISPDGTMCAISRINLKKIHEFRNEKSPEFLKMQFEFKQGKAKVLTNTLRNQMYCRKKTTVTRLHTSSGYVSDPLGLRKIMQQ